MAKVHPAESAISLLAVNCFIAIVIQLQLFKYLSLMGWHVINYFSMTCICIHLSYLYPPDSALVDYQVLGQQNGTGCMVMF